MLNKIFSEPLNNMKANESSKDSARWLAYQNVMRNARAIVNGAPRNPVKNSLENPNGNGAGQVGGYGVVGPQPPATCKPCAVPGEAKGMEEARNRATTASGAAEADGTPEAHEAAQNAHNAAAKLATRLGASDVAVKHANKAIEHKKKAQTLREAAPAANGGESKKS